MKIKTDISMLKENGPTKEFLHFCDIEIEQLLNSGKDFNEADFYKAVELVVKRLKNIEEDSML